MQAAASVSKVLENAPTENICSLESLHETRSAKVVLEEE